jgi:polyhydroxyalkanoate synthase subunit PhaC
VMRLAGMSTSLDEAQAQLTENWRKWLAWANLQERRQEGCSAAGSWWPDWQAWIEGLDGERVPAREIGAGLLKPIEDAPGSYVRVKG